MTTYAKLTTDGQLNVLQTVPNIMGAKEHHFAAYAAEHGYKPYRPTMLYTKAMLYIWHCAHKGFYNAKARSGAFV